MHSTKYVSNTFFEVTHKSEEKIVVPSTRLTVCLSHTRTHMDRGGDVLVIHVFLVNSFLKSILWKMKMVPSTCLRIGL